MHSVLYKKILKLMPWLSSYIHTIILSAQWKPGYHGPACQGPSHLLKISPRTRLSKPGETPVPVEVSTGVPTTEDLAKGLSRPRQASRRLVPFKLALHLWQSAHGLCASRRVPGAPKRDDDSAPVAVLMNKGVNKAAPSKADNETYQIGRASCRERVYVLV